VDINGQHHHLFDTNAMRVQTIQFLSSVCKFISVFDGVWFF